MLTGAVVFSAAAAAPPLRLIAVVAVLTMAGGLVAGSPWLITVAFGVTVVEIGLASTAGSISPAWIAALAVGVFLAVEASVAALEMAGDVIAPREPAAHRLLVTVSKAGVVWADATAVALIAVGRRGGRTRSHRWRGLRLLPPPCWPPWHDSWNDEPRGALLGSSEQPSAAIERHATRRLLAASRSDPP